MCFPSQTRIRSTTGQVTRTVACRLLLEQTGNVSSSHLRCLLPGNLSVPGDAAGERQANGQSQVPESQHLPLHERIQDRRRAIESLMLSAPLHTLSFPRGLNPGVSTISERPMELVRPFCVAFLLRFGTRLDRRRHKKKKPLFWQNLLQRIEAYSSVERRRRRRSQIGRAHV